MKMLIAEARTGEDRFPVMLRDDCDRTCPDEFGKDESLISLWNRLSIAGYDLKTYEQASQKLEVYNK